VKTLLIAALWMPLLSGAAEHRVVIDAMQFSPQVVEARPGDTIVWENRDMFVHNVTGAAAGVGSGDLAPGKTWRYVVRRRDVVRLPVYPASGDEGAGERQPGAPVQPWRRKATF